MADINYNSDESSSETEDEFQLKQEEIKQEIKEYDDFDNFLNVFYNAQEYHNFYFLKWVPSYKVYNLIKYDFDKYPNYCPFNHKIEKCDYDWCCDMIEAADPEIEYISDSHIYYFFVKMMHLDSVNKDYLKKNNIKLPYKQWIPQ